MDDDARAVADLAEFVENCKKPLFFVGDGAALCYNKYDNVPGVLCVPPALRNGRAAAVAYVAEQMAQRGEAVLPEALLPDYHRLSQAVGQQPAYCDIGREAEHHAGALLPAAEGEVLVEKKADHAAHQIVGGGGDPVARVSPEVEAGQVVKAEHDTISHQGVHHPDQEEAEKGGIKDLFQHGAPPRRCRTGYTGACLSPPHRSWRYSSR